MSHTTHKSCGVISYFVTVCLLFAACSERRENVYKYLHPQYTPLHLTATKDSIHFSFDEDTYNNIRSFNYFIDNGKEYIAFYDKQSLSVNMYEFRSQILVKKIFLNKLLPQKGLVKRTTVYCKNFDSLYVINSLALYHLNRSGKLIDSIGLQREPVLAFSSFSKGNPPVFKDGLLYLVAAPYLSTTKTKEIRKWKSVYQINLQTGKVHLMYPMPESYEHNLYDASFFDNSYCYNNGKFIFSFPADTNIYETDFSSYNVSYYGKSKFHQSYIGPTSKNDLETEEGVRRATLLNDFYGTIFYDPYHKRYLRMVELKINEDAYRQKRWEKEISVIIFDENLKIIGESKIDNSIGISSLFFTIDGSMYARVSYRDESAIHFVKLTYDETNFSNTEIVIKR